MAAVRLAGRPVVLMPQQYRWEVRLKINEKILVAEVVAGNSEQASTSVLNTPLPDGRVPRQIGACVDIVFIKSLLDVPYFVRWESSKI